SSGKVPSRRPDCPDVTQGLRVLAAARRAGCCDAFPLAYERHTAVRVGGPAAEPNATALSLVRRRRRNGIFLSCSAVRGESYEGRENHRLLYRRRSMPGLSGSWGLQSFFPIREKRARPFADYQDTAFWAGADRKDITGPPCNDGSLRICVRVLGICF